MKTVIREKPRIDVLDALKSFALFGIILAHMDSQFYNGAIPPINIGNGLVNTFDNVIQKIHIVLVIGKFYTIFSFLFGLSFGIQLLNSKLSNREFFKLYSLRLLVLFIIGVLHSIIFSGDVLTIYAVLGFSLFLFYKFSNKILLCCAFLLVLNIPGYVLETISVENKPDNSTKANAATQGLLQDNNLIQVYNTRASLSYQMVKQGDFVTISKTNIIYELKNKFIDQVNNGRLFVTLGLFILGLYMAKREIFENLYARTKTVKKVFYFSLLLCLFIIGYYIVFRVRPFHITHSLNGVFTLFIDDVFNITLSALYVSGFIMLFNFKPMQRKMSFLLPLGRMSLTTYLTQSAIGVLIFYGYGLNLLDVIGRLPAFFIAIFIFISQVYFSNWWMKNHEYGPAEMGLALTHLFKDTALEK